MENVRKENVMVNVATKIHMAHDKFDITMDPSFVLRATMEMYLLNMLVICLIVCNGPFGFLNLLLLT